MDFNIGGSNVIAGTTAAAAAPTTSAGRPRRPATASIPAYSSIEVTGTPYMKNLDTFD